MSAFVVEDKTINHVVNWLRIATSRHPYDYITGPLVDLGFDTKSGPSCETLAQQMFDLNCNAVEQRYPDSKASDFRPLDFEYKFEPYVRKPLAVLKALQCWLYQCMEGDVPKTSRLYHAMRKVEANIALAYATSRPEYEQAKWG